MADQFAQLLEPYRKASLGTGQNGEWLWRAYSSGVIKQVWESTKHDEPATLAYCSALVEGMNTGLIDSWYDPRQRSHLNQLSFRSMLEFLLLVVVPEGIATVPGKDCTARIAEAFNLGENLYGAEPWMDPYLLVRCLESPPQLKSLEHTIGAWLKPLLEAASAVTWKGPYATQVVGLSATDNSFLPGEMRVLGPRIVAVADRREQDSWLALILREDAEPMVLALRGRKPATMVAQPQVLLRFGPSQLSISDTDVELPFLDHMQSHAVLPCGAVVVSAVDSQHLWIVTPQTA